MKNIIKSMLLLFTMFLAGCSNEGDSLRGEEPLLPGENIVHVTVHNDLTTRAARPIGGSQAANNVNKVQLVIYKSVDGSWMKDTGVEFKTTTGEIIADGLLNWTPAEDGQDWNVSHDVSQIVRIANLMSNTSYRIVGYGYNGDSEPFTKTEDNGSFQTESIPEVQEIFAGSIEATTNDVGIFDQNQTLRMDRQVAGMLACFKDVPVQYGRKTVAKVVVQVNRKASNIQFPSSDAFNGKDMQDRTGDSGYFPILTFNVSDINTGTTYYDNGKENIAIYAFNAVSGGQITGTDGKKPFAQEYTNIHSGLNLSGNSIFGACFLLPYDKHYSEQTFVVDLQDENGSLLKRMNIKLSDDSQVPDGGTAYACDIRRNYFYSLGKLDAPISLTTENDLIIIIDDSWDGVHEFEPDKSN